jgi:hypothetical protein
MVVTASFRQFPIVTYYYNTNKRPRCYCPSFSSLLPSPSCQTLPKQSQSTVMHRHQHNQHREKCDSTLVSPTVSSIFVNSNLLLYLGTQYQVLDVVGEGAYGIVCSALHRPSGRKVAIKKIAPFDHSMFCLRTLRELKLLKFLSEAGVSENVRSYRTWGVPLDIN